MSVISSIYGPLGFLAPVLLSVKKILGLCRQQLGWDDPLPISVVQEWNVWLEKLHQLKEVRRCLKPLGFGKICSALLHHFADASEDGYGTVTYLLLYDLEKRVHCALMMGKARVAPLKSIAIPRMELTASVAMANRMSEILRTSSSGVGKLFDSRVTMGSSIWQRDRTRSR